MALNYLVSTSTSSSASSSSSSSSSSSLPSPNTYVYDYKQQVYHHHHHQQHALQTIQTLPLPPSTSSLVTAADSQLQQQSVSNFTNQSNSSIFVDYYNCKSNKKIIIIIFSYQFSIYIFQIYIDFQIFFFFLYLLTLYSTLNERRIYIVVVRCHYRHRQCISLLGIADIVR